MELNTTSTRRISPTHVRHFSGTYANVALTRVAPPPKWVAHKKNTDKAYRAKLGYVRLLHRNAAWRLGLK